MTRDERRLDIDVLVCAYNEAPHIPALFESLRRQTVGSDRFDIIFVDNASTDETPRVVAEHSFGLNVRSLREERKGKSWACKTGYQSSKATYVAHLDADTKADPGWLEQIRKVIDEERPDVFGGPYFPYYTTPKPRWYRDAYNQWDGGRERRCLGPHEYLCGANMTWRRLLVEELGGFSVDLNNLGRGIAGVEDTNLQVRARSADPSLRILYDPGIVVYHLTRPLYFSLGYLTRRCFVTGRYDRMMIGTTQGTGHRGRAAFRLLRAGVSSARGALGAVVVRDRTAYPFWKNYYVERVVPEFYRLGRDWDALFPHARHKSVPTS
jgi:glycosyltransferase involved in cell wall biosynthesis